MATSSKRTKKRASRSARASGSRQKSNKSGPAVRVRMYRQGLGDCFLITFDVGGNEVHMLIDCGSLGATTTGVTLDQVVADIRKVTNDHLHLLVGTHEHQDHVCGFRNCRSEFAKIKVDQVWLAWTENPQDPLAKQIEKYKGDLGIAVANTANALALADESDKQSKALGEAINSVLGFVGDAKALGASGLAKTIDEAMQFVRTGFGKEACYLSPGGAAIEEDWLPGFRFYVLGPPRSAAALSNLGDYDSNELYRISSGLNVGAAFRLSGSTSNSLTSENEMPFDPRFRRTADDPILAEVIKNYHDSSQAWRRIDNDWLHAAADLALQLDSMTNNTSLALAIERVSDGKVLLFPADAQQGNWLSWHDANMAWTFGGTKKKTAAELLAATVFYKVGHHSSHNGTAKGKGLELMVREDELVAFIPVDRGVALKRNPKDSWQMPARPLYLHLLQKCQGRVARSDLGWADDAKSAKNTSVEKEFMELADARTWNGWKQCQQKAAVTIQPMFIEFMLA
jgi:hypothetical protein